MGDSEPVVIGGIGGSGTRVFARLLRDFGFYLGGDLNAALDNEWFGFLLGGRSRWYRSGGGGRIPTALRLFEKAMRGEPSIGPLERIVLDEAAREWSDWAVENIGIDRAKADQWSLEHARSVTESTGPEHDATGWGWKNPNAHVFIEHLAEAFPGMRYVHVIRNGLDLVDKPKVTRQVRDWGPVFGVEPPQGRDDPAPEDALQYWIRANRRVLESGPALFGDRLIVLRYESACEDPAGTAATMADFLDVRAAPSAIASFAAFVCTPSGERGLPAVESRFGPKDLAEVRALM